MNRSVIQLVVLVVLCAASFYVGRLMGAAQVYQETSRTQSDQYARNATVNLRSHLRLLELLQSNQEQVAAQKLETLVTVDLMALKRYPYISAPQNEEARTLIQTAEQYLKDHPVPGRRKP